MKTGTKFISLKFSETFSNISIVSDTTQKLRANIKTILVMKNFENENSSYKLSFYLYSNFRMFTNSSVYVCVQSRIKKSVILDEFEIKVEATQRAANQRGRLFRNLAQPISNRARSKRQGSSSSFSTLFSVQLCAPKSSIVQRNSKSGSDIYRDFFEIFFKVFL